MKTEYIDYLIAAGLDSIQGDRLNVIGYFGQPARMGHHLAERGGLVTHSVNVTRRLVELTETLGVKWSRNESPYLVGMLHDLVKCRCYRYVTEELGKPKWVYVQPAYPGHGACSVMIAAELGFQLRRDEIAAIIYHMGSWGSGKEYTAKEFGAAMKLYAPQIIATHTADWWAARVDESEAAR